MSEYSSLSHTKSGVQVPRCVHTEVPRERSSTGKIRRRLGEIFHELARQKESEILEGHLCPDHVHMMVRIPPKRSVSEVVGYIKGKSAIRAAREFQGRGRNFRGYHFWARGYFVSTVGNRRTYDSRWLSTFAIKKRTTRNSTNSVYSSTERDLTTKTTALSGSHWKPPALPEVTHSKVGCDQPGYPMTGPISLVDRDPVNPRKRSQILVVGGH